MKWWELGKCRDGPVDLWFPANHMAARNGSPTVRRAKAICAECPVRAECLADVMKHEQDGRRHGIWGGLHPQERDELARDRRRKRTP